MAIKQIGELPAASSVAGTDVFPLQQASATRQATLAQVQGTLIPRSAEFQAAFKIANPASGTVVLLDHNRVIGAIVGADLRMEVGTCTATLRIADDEGVSPVTITGLGAIAVNTSTTEATATAANVMLITTGFDRQLNVLLASVAGVGPLHIGIRYTRA